MIKTGIRYYGYSRSNNPDVIRYMFSQAGCPEFADNGNWCGVYINYLAHIKEVDRPKNPQVARHWLKVGKSVEDPMTGDLVIYWRESKDSWKGHVGIYVNRAWNKKIYTLGGNQGSTRSVCISLQPSERVLGFRRLIQ